MELKEIHPECGQDLVDWDARFADRGLDNPYKLLARDYETKLKASKPKKIWVLTYTQWGSIHDQEVFLNEVEAKEAFVHKIRDQQAGKEHMRHISNYERCFTLSNGYRAIIALTCFDVPAGKSSGKAKGCPP